MKGFSGSRAGLIVAVALVMVLSSFAAVAISRASLTPVTPATKGAAAPAVTTSTPTPSATSNSAFATSASRLATVEADKAATLANGGNLSLFEPPNLHQAPPLSKTGDHVTPLYSVAPAPMGVAYYGLSNTSGTTTPTEMNTTSLQGFFTTSDTLGVQTEEFDFGTQTAYGAQLNAVLTNVSILGQTAFGPNVNAPAGCTGFYTGADSDYCPNQFWLQNVINYNTATHSLSFENNIWNFSNPAANWATTNGITLRGGSSPSGGYYAVSGPSITIAYPFTVVLYLNSTVGKCVVGGTGKVGASSCTDIASTGPVNEVFFNYTVLNSAGHVVCPTTERTRQVCGEYDDVFFNSISSSINPAGVKFGSAEISANGYQYDPLGLTNDWEMDWGIGTSSGATTIVYYANAQVGINYCPAAKTSTTTGKCSQYAAPPAAYDYGGETGETNIGASGYYTTETGGAPNPSFLTTNGAPVAHFTTGPSNLIGLWNTSTAPGAFALNYANINPANAWVGIAPGADVTNQSKFQVASTFGWYSARGGSGGSKKPTGLGANIYLPPGMYTVEVLLSGYDPVIQNVNLLTSSQAPVITLTKDASTGVYTPMWAYSASDLANLSTSGAGTSSSPYVMVSGTSTVGAPFGQAGSLALLFSNLNDYLFTLWIGAYFNGTHAYATFNQASEFLIDYPSWQYYTLGLFDAPHYDGLQYYLFHAQNVTIANATDIYTWANSEATSVTSLVCNTCLNDLIAGNTFDVSDIAMSFTGSTGALSHNTFAGSRNVIWGNTLVSYPQPTYTGLDSPSRFISESDGFDRIYNNAFDSNLTNSETSTTNFNFWNETCQPGYTPIATGQYPSATPCRAAGYSQTMNGLTLTGSIIGSSYQGGNYWVNYGGYANPYGNIPYLGRTTTYSSGGFGQPTGKHVGDFAPLINYDVYKFTFVESGLASSTTTTAFRVSVTNSLGAGNRNSSATSAVPAGCSGQVCVNFFEPSGSNVFRATSTLSGIYADPAYGTFSIGSGPITTPFSIAYGTGYAVTFTETGLPSGITWYVNASGEAPLSTTTTASGGNTVSFTAPNGVYAYTVATAEKVWELSSGSPVTVDGTVVPVNLAASQVYETLSFAETGLPSGTAWYVNFTSGVDLSGTTASLSTSVTNGTYPYTVATTDKIYHAAGGEANVRGATTQPVAFNPVDYTVTFGETGLPTGASWSVIVDPCPPHVYCAGNVTESGVSPSLAFSLTNGTYGYTVQSANLSYEAAPGTFTINGDAIGDLVAFSTVSYAVTVTESGLPSGTAWYANASGIGLSLSSTTNTASTSLTNGTYHFVIASADRRYAAAPGEAIVAGSAVTVDVTFALYTYSTTFTESALPAGTTWYLNLSGEPTQQSTGATITIDLPNGTYSYGIGSADLIYAAAPGQVTVSGEVTSVDFNFQKIVYTAAFTSTGVPSGTEYYVNVSGTAKDGALINDVGHTISNSGAGISFALPNGSYSYTVGSTNHSWAAAPGAFSIDGAGTSKTLAFTEQRNAVTFTETGLSAQKLAKDGWTATLGGVTVTTHTATASLGTFTNGTYQVLIQGPNGETNTLASVYTETVNGVATFPLIFSAGATATWTFAEKGLTTGTPWCVEVQSAKECSTSGTSVYKGIAAGHVYDYAVVSPTKGQTITDKVGTTTYGASGSFELAKSTKMVLTFAYPYEVTFTQSGLTTGTWSITVKGATVTRSVGQPIDFNLTNGSYAYKIGAESGFKATGSVKRVIVTGASPAPVVVTFTAKGHMVPATGAPGVLRAGRADLALPVLGSALDVVGIVGLLGAALAIAGSGFVSREEQP